MVTMKWRRWKCLLCVSAAINGHGLAVPVVLDRIGQAPLQHFEVMQVRGFRLPRGVQLRLGFLQQPLY